MSNAVNLRIASLPSNRLAFSNRVYVSRTVFATLLRNCESLGHHPSTADPCVNVSFNRFVFQASPHDEMNGDEVGLNQLQRKCGSFTLNQVVAAVVFIPTADVALAGITFGVDMISKKKDAPRVDLNVTELTESFKMQFCGQVFCAGQGLAMDFNGMKLDVVVDSFDHAAIGLTGENSKAKYSGQVIQVTNINWKKQNGSQSNIVFTGQSGGASASGNALFRNDFDFEKMGIGGLGHQFQTMLRRAFASRIFPETVKELGINHVRGILLYGPPGCGKTLIARQIGKILNAREPKIINGPEVLDKFVGGSEEKIRELFADAEKEQAEMGDASMLHIIIFDEMDAIMKTRGSTRDNTGVSDSIVNQLLSKIDGVDSLNNILIIGMTNRKDMIDEAILRPGRLELHIEISLPDEVGRLQIIHIHTASMKKHNRISDEALAKLPELAEMTKNFTGAELEGLVRSAASFALARNISKDIKAVDPKSVKVEWRDFVEGLKESIPAYGNKDAEEIKSYFRNGICMYSPNFRDLWGRMERLLTQIRTSTRTPLLSLLLEGEAATGKTALAAKLCAECDFPFVRMISASSMIGISEGEKCNRLLKVFSDAYKSPLSIIFIDDIERILEYTSIGPRFSNVVLQTLLVLIRKIPSNAESRLMVVATTSISGYLDGLGLTQAFQVKVTIPTLSHPQEIATVLEKYSNVTPSLSAPDIDDIAKTFDGTSIGVKQLMMVLEMARAESADNNQENVTTLQFMDCLATLGF